MRRRDFLAGCGSLTLAGSGLPGLALAQAPVKVPVTVPDKIIDVHCHVFNGADLPMEQFVEKAIAGAALRKKNYRPLAPVVDAVVQDLAKRIRLAAKDENKFLDQIHGGFGRNAKEIEDAERALLRELFSAWHDGKRKPLPRGSKLEANTVYAYLPYIVVGFVRRELWHDTIYNGPVDLSLGAALNNEDDAFTWEATSSNLAFDPKYLADQVFDGTLPEGSKGEIIGGLRWGLKFLHYRREMLDELAKVNHQRAVLVTPALVDYEKWLDAPDSVSMGDQAKLMARLSLEKRTDTSTSIPKMHGFIAFDPLRQAIHEKLNAPAAESPRAVAEKAVMTQGFIGIKLYPPMGFRASDNAGAGDDFPCWVRFGKGSSPTYEPRCEVRANGPDALGNEPGAILDRTMMSLFEWCAANNIPVMAHTNNSIESGPGYGARANPKYWLPVLQKLTQQNLPPLQVNFAHFGGFEEAYRSGRFDDKLLEQTWEWTIGKMVEANPQWRVFSDFADLTNVLDKDSSERRQALLCMRRYRARFGARAAKTLMYGTDWSMLGRDPAFQKRPTRYPDIIAQFLADAGFGKDDRDDIFFNNAVRFLGLRLSDRASGTRGRLERFYPASDAAWMDAFNQVT